MILETSATTAAQCPGMLKGNTVSGWDNLAIMASLGMSDGRLWKVNSTSLHGKARLGERRGGVHRRTRRKVRNTTWNGKQGDREMQRQKWSTLLGRGGNKPERGT